MQFDLYVPRANLKLAVDPRSAIVGTSSRQWLEGREARIDRREPREVGGDTNLVIDFEGNRYNASNMVTYADRAMHAAGRQRECYPTVARAIVPSRQLVRVATLDYDHEQVRCLDEDGVLELLRWLEVTHEQLQVELRGTSMRAVRAARDLDIPA
jgi:hypothetical protein